MQRVLGLLIAQLASIPLFAQTDASELEALKAAVAEAQSAGDNAWMLVCAALVLAMTGPGLALFYGGLVRKKNVLSTMMHSFIMMALATVLWVVIGYSLAFGEGTAVIGSLQYFMLNGVGTAPNDTYAGTIPEYTFMVFQMMFTIITPAIISGAFAERMKFKAMLLFMTLWLLVIYYPMAHMVWGTGGLLGGAGALPCFDFAGGTVVHITSGVSALVCAIYLGKRLGYGSEPMKPHNLVLSVVGACLLWVGWFGFNAGSALSAGAIASSAFVATQVATGAAVIGWLLVEWIQMGKPSMLGAISGAVAGLVVITPAAGFVSPQSSLIMGFIGGIVCYFAVVKVKKVLGYDDTLDAFGIHGVGGTVGAVLTGVFASHSVNEALPEMAGLLDGNGGQVVNQILGSLLSWVLAIVGTLVILKICDIVIGLRVTREEEIDGLDLTQHGEEGYSLDA
jgi:Amt family ammonium transporter